MSEKTLWKTVSRGMRGRWDAQRHEDGLSPRIPDVSFGLHNVDGWIELKYLKRYPKRKFTQVRVKFRPGQVAWLERRAKRGSGSCWVLLQIDRDYYLVHALNARYLEEGLWHDSGLAGCDLDMHSTGVWRGAIDYSILSDMLTRKTR